MNAKVQRIAVDWWIDAALAVFAGILIFIMLTCGVGCSPTFEAGTARPNSFPVLTGAATTNDSQAVAWLKEVKQVNGYAPTPVQAPVNYTLDALIGLGTFAAGWITRHKTVKKTAT